MRSLQWSTSDAVWVTELDDEHREIFAAVAGLQKSLDTTNPAAEARRVVERLAAAIEEHFAHEERLMRAARYESLGWHKQLHDHARDKAVEWAGRIDRGDTGAGRECVDYLVPWLQNHTRVADRMLGSFLRNQRRCARLTFRAGTRPADAPGWVRADGERFDPRGSGSGS